MSPANTDLPGEERRSEPCALCDKGVPVRVVPQGELVEGARRDAMALSRNAIVQVYICNKCVALANVEQTNALIVQPVRGAMLGAQPTLTEAVWFLQLKCGHVYYEPAKWKDGGETICCDAATGKIVRQPSPEHVHPPSHVECLCMVCSRKASGLPMKIDPKLPSELAEALLAGSHSVAEVECVSCGKRFRPPLAGITICATCAHSPGVPPGAAQRALEAVKKEDAKAKHTCSVLFPGKRCEACEEEKGKQAPVPSFTEQMMAGVKDVLDPHLPRCFACLEDEHCAAPRDLRVVAYVSVPGMPDKIIPIVGAEACRPHARAWTESANAGIGPFGIVPAPPDHPARARSQALREKWQALGACLLPRIHPEMTSITYAFPSKEASALPGF